jgi:hypothetical protein
VAGQAALAMPSEHDYTEYEFSWDFIDMEWDSSGYTSAYALEEGGQINLYISSFRYDDNTLQFIPSETVIVYGLKESIGVELNFIDATGTFYADSLLSSIYDDDAKTFIPFVFGYLTPHANGKLEKLELYINSTGATEPPFIFLPFLSTQMYYDPQDRVVGYTSTELDIFDLMYSKDSVSLVLNGDGLVVEEFDYYDDTLATYSTYAYNPGVIFPATQVDCYYDAGILYLKDSILTIVTSTQLRTEIQYRWDVGSQSEYEVISLTTITTPTTSLMTTTYHTFDGVNPPHATYQERREYDDEGRLSSILERADWPFDTLTNSGLRIFIYPTTSGVSAVPDADPGFSYTLVDKTLEFQFDELFEGNIELFSTSGICVVRSRNLTGVQDCALSLGSLLPGIYYTRISGNKIRNTFGIVLSE